MSTLAEIESAIARLPEDEVAALREWLDAREASRSPLAKWQGHGTGVVQQSGGVDAYLRQMRGDDDDGR